MDSYGPTEAKLEFIGLKFTIAHLVVKIIDSQATLFPFGIGSKSRGLERNTDAPPLGTVIGGKADVFFEIPGSGWVLKDRIVVELRPMDILGERRGYPKNEKNAP
jgi:hypothetical protein